MKTVTKGDILIAEPFLEDPNFQRSVILLCDHNDAGSFGLVLSQVASLELSEVIEDLIFGEHPLYIGGPVEINTLHFIHKRPDLITNSTRVIDDVFWGGNFEEIKNHLNSGALGKNEIRFFAGYSGWSAGQLDAELSTGSWIISRADSEFLFSTPPEQFWRAILKNMGGKYRSIAHYPIDPSLN